MKNVILYSLPLMVAGSIYCNAAQANGTLATEQNSAATELMKSLKNKVHAAPRAKVVGFGNAAAKAATDATSSAIGEMKGKTVSFLSDENGNVWYYTQKTTYKDDSWGAAISKAEIEIFNNKHESAGTITVDVPEGMSVNAVTPYGTITKKFFDLNDKDYELLVELHQTGNADNNYQGKYYTYVYHLDGTKTMEFEGSGVFLNIVKNAWTKYQRFILTNANYEAVDGKTYEDGSPYMTTMAHINIYKPASWGSSQPSVEKEFTVDEDYTYYGNDEVPVTIYNIGGDPYYVISHYSKIYDSGQTDEETGFFIPTEDNSVVIKTYDKSYNLVDDINIPIPAASDTKYRMAQIGNFADWSVSKNMFTDDGNLAYVLTYYDMTTKVDDYRYSFVAYDHQGNKISTICDGVYNTWFKLKSIPGAEEQMAFMQYVDDDEEQQQIKIVNIPSLEGSKTMRAYIDDNMISTVMNRYGDADNYKYVVKVSQGEVDKDNNVISKIMWLNQDMKIDHFTKFNLGPNAENFMLTLSDTYVDPYLFNTNDKMEFFFQAKMKKSGSNSLENVYMIGDEDGNILHTFSNNDKGTISSMGCFDSGENGKEMYVAYTDDSNSYYDYNFYKLPLTKFDKGGDGSADNPYLIASAGDLMQVSQEPTANYKLAGDIEMAAYNNTNDSWTPISNFSGKLDGDNHHINGLTLNTNQANVGLFADLEQNAEVKNLILTNPDITLNEQNSTVGTVAATSISANISNVHVYAVDITGDADATVGGIIGQAALNSKVSEVSVNDADIKVPNSSAVGGIAGDIRTSATVEAAAVKNTDITGANNVGGIVGTTLQSTVQNAHFTGNLTAENTVGGIIGSNSETVTDKCIFDGTVTANNASMWNGYSAAGIIGSLAADWTESTTPIVTNNIVKGQIETVNIDNAKNAATDNTVHRIVGRTIANDTEQDSEQKTEKRLANNWAVNTTTVNGKTISSTDENGVEGYDAAETDINAESLAQIGYGFGTSAASPWKESGASLPVIYFENDVKTIVVSQDNISLYKDATATIAAYAYGDDNAEITATSSAPEIVEVTNTGKDEDDITMIDIKAKATGTANINISAGNITVVCAVTVNETSGISAATTGNGSGMRILPGNGIIKADGATSINVYSADGSNVASTNASTIATSKMGKGMFIVVATDAKGNKQTAKVIIK